MHSTIFQIATQPIQPDEYVGIDNIEAGEMASIFYAREAEKSERAERIKILVGRILPAGMFVVSPDGETLIYKGGFTEWKSLFVTTFYGSSGTAERSRELMRLIGGLQIGARHYVGAIFDYHF